MGMRMGDGDSGDGAAPDHRLARAEALQELLSHANERDDRARVAEGLRLLDTNSSRVINDLAERVRESGRRLRGEIGTLLRAVTPTARLAADRAKESRERGEDAVHAELVRLEQLERDVLGVVA